MTPTLIDRIRSKKAKTVIVGLGYVGAPLLGILHRHGIPVVGFDVDADKVARYRADGIVATDRPEEAFPDADVIVICVPTPIDLGQRPDLTFVLRAAETVQTHLSPDTLVVLESTVAPGTTEEYLLPVLERSGLRPGKDLFVAHCPERVDPGNPSWDVHNLPRVVGGIDGPSLEAAAAFYEAFVDGEVMRLSRVEAAEAVKIVENTFRDVNIAFVNELAMSFDKLGIDITEVIRGAATKPFGFLAHWPGAGVGGHCIAVDPYYLIAHADQHGFNHRFLKIAREVNNAMPGYTVQKTLVGLNRIGRSVKGTRVAVLGLAYKPEIDDSRESPAGPILKELRSLGAELTVYDPFVPSRSTAESLQEAVQGQECVVLVTAHKEFLAMGPAELQAAGVKVLVDGRNAFDQAAVEAAGLVYEGIGRRHRGTA